MNVQSFVGKTKEEAIIKAMEGLNAKEDELIIAEKEVKKGLFNKKAEILAITKTELKILWFKLFHAIMEQLHIRYRKCGYGYRLLKWNT